MIKWLVVGTRVVDILVLALGSLSIYESRLRYEERVGITTRNLAQVLEETVDGDVDKIDLALRATDADGVVRNGRGMPATGEPNDSDREYFIRAHDESAPALRL